MAHHNHHPSSTIQIYSCALTGLSPLSDPVVTPSGHICSRKLLLTKLAENGGVDPFDDKGVRRLDESALIDLALAAGGGAAAVIPPRAPKSTSLPHLLTLLQSEFDAVLLELYDTRHALEETRKELSSALYQNDAAIRVVARLAQERDESRSMLERYLNDGGVPKQQQQQPAAAEEAGGAVVAHKRAREENNAEEEEDMPAPKKAAKVSTATTEESDAVSSDLTKIPPSELDAMSTTWKQLTSNRRAIAKLKRTPMEISKNEDLLSNLAKKENGEESKKVNLGKASAKAGILCMTTLRTTTMHEEDGTGYLITGGHDKNAIVYNVSMGTIVATLSGASGDIVSVHGKEVSEGGSIQIVTGSADGHVRLYKLMSDGKKKEMTSTLLGTAKLETGVPVNVVLHPSSTNVDARILVASSSGRVELYKWSSNSTSEDDTLKLVTRLESSPKEGSEGNDMIEYTSGCMHPDGFIYIAGTSDGSLIVWDLKSQAVAGTLKGHDGLAIDCIAISENGYHVATTSSSSSPNNNNNNNNSPIHIWDLRKLKLSATITPADDVGTVMSLAFDPTASYLAYSGEVCTKICVAKDWDRVVCTLTPSKKGAAKKGKKAPSAGSVGKLSGAVVWGGEGFGLKEGEGGNVWLAVGCDGERPVRFWGLE